MENKFLYRLVGILMLLLLVLGFLYFRALDKNKDLKYENFKLDANIAALNDTLRTSKNKIDELEYNRKSFITDRIEELEALNTDLAHEVKVTKGKVVALQKAKGKIQIIETQIPVFIDSSKFKEDSILRLGLDLDTTYSEGNYRKLQGEITVSKDQKQATADIRTEIGLSLTTGLKQNEKGDFEIFFRSLYPGLTITQLDGAYIPKNQIQKPVKRPRLSLGMNLSYSPLAYDFDERGLKLRNQVTAGVGLSYRFF